VESLLVSEPAVAALGGITHLNLRECYSVTDELLLHLPASLRTLSVGGCYNLTAAASFAHLTALTSLDCSTTRVMDERADGLPASLQELDASNGMRELWRGDSLAHLSQLRVLRAEWSGLDTIVLALLPTRLEELHAVHCKWLNRGASFAHLTTLRELDIADSAIGDGELTTMPPSLVYLNVRGCEDLTPDAVLPHLPVLQLLDVRDTRVGDAMIASLPATLVELRLAGCCSVTEGARMDHLRALRALHCLDTELAPAALAACRARGCVVPAANYLRGHESRWNVVSLVLLAEGRLASRDLVNTVHLWDVATGGILATTTALRASGLAALPHGRRLAIGTAQKSNEGCIMVWDVGDEPPTCRATIPCCGGMGRALAVLPDGRLAAGCADGAVQIVDIDAGVVVTTLSTGTSGTSNRHTDCVTALAVLPDGTLASGSWNGRLRVWDVGARACVATLAEHAGQLTHLAVLADGRLASLTIDGDEVRLC